MDFPILSWMIFIPLIGGMFILCTPKGMEKTVKGLALVFSFIPLVLAGMVYANFNHNTAELQFVEKILWIPAFNIHYSLGIDGLSISIFLLTALLTFLSVLISCSITKRVKEYFILFLILETGMLGVFVAMDLFLFYIFWEVVLLPMYFLIGIWGGPRRKYAAIKFVLYTVAGSLIMLVGILCVYFTSNPHTLDIIELSKTCSFAREFQNLMFFLFFLGFAVKVPIWPFHTWLPDAHVEAPTAASVILAGILLKMGIYGFLRVSFPIFPDAAIYFAYPFAVLGVINIIYGALTAMAQNDLKKMIAYSSISHMGFCLIAMSALTVTGINGAIIQMFTHGAVTGSLFMLVGVIYDRAHTRNIDEFSGLWHKMPIYTGMMTIAVLASLGLPGLAGFIGEFVCLMGTFVSTFPGFKLLAILSTSGVVITAVYLLWMMERVFWRGLSPKWEHLTDINKIELLAIIPILIVVILIGVCPKLLVDLMNVSTTQMVHGIMQ
ncbi:NADH-quinone oxidoreductase subunit M [bacterium]|nr:NADH-quinone oxidoreductase subunit M [bacterium]